MYVGTKKGGIIDKIHFFERKRKKEKKFVKSLSIILLFVWNNKIKKYK